MSVSRRSFVASSLAAAASAPAALSQEAFANRFDEIPPRIIDAGAAGGPAPNLRGRLQYHCDEDDQTIAINDFQLFSPTAGLAVGLSERKGRTDGMALTTSDGKTWRLSKTKDIGLNLSPVGDKTVYMMGATGLWLTDSTASTFEKKKLPRLDRDERPLRSHFFNARRGVLLGGGVPLFQTEDGGLTWTKLPATLNTKLKSSNTVWTSVTAIPNGAIIIGHSEATKEISRFPPWMMPETYVRRRVTPSTTMLARTYDDGGKWEVEVTSTIGVATRIRSIRQSGYLVYHYGDSLDFPSELFQLDYRTGKGTSLFRRKDLLLWDVAPFGESGLIVAAIQPTGRLRNSGVPGKLRLLVTSDLTTWQDLKVDYRAMGTRAMLAFASDRLIWAATDEGSIVHVTA